MIIVKNSQLNNETLSALDKLTEVDINATVAFKLARIIREITSIVEDKNKMERRIKEKYSGDLDNSEYLSEMKDLGNVENEIGYDRINFEELNLKTAKVKDLIRLEFLFN